MLTSIRRSLRSARRRRLAPLLLTLSVSVIVGACGPTQGSGSPSSSVAPSEPTGATASAAAPSTAPSPSIGPSASAAPSASSATTQTDTEWGRIWDAVPAGFPRYPGGTTADDATDEPVSAAYVVAGADPAELAAWMQTSVETATYSTEALSGPLEDGGYVLDSVGDGDCRIETKMAPQGDLILVTIRYGAACPAP